MGTTPSSYNMLCGFSRYVNFATLWRLLVSDTNFHSFDVLQQQRRIYQPHPQPLPAAFINEFGRPSHLAPQAEGDKDRYAQEEARYQQQQQSQQHDQRGSTNAELGGDRAASVSSSQIYANARRPDAPVPPTPPHGSGFYSSVAPTPYPLIYSPGPVRASAMAATPAPGEGSFVPRRRDFVEPALPTSTTMAAPPSPIQMQRYYPGGPRYYQAPPSLPSTAMSSPFTGPINPFIRSHPHLGGVGVDRESVVSSPSHHPVPLMFPRRTKKTKTRGVGGVGMSKANGSREALPIPAAGTAAAGITQRGPREAPPRVQSTIPPSSDTDPLEGQDDDDDGDLTEGREDPRVNVASRVQAMRTTPTVRDSTEDDDESDLWMEDDEDDDSRLENELHPTYVANAIRRNQRFQEKFSELVHLVCIRSLF